MRCTCGKKLTYHDMARLSPTTGKEMWICGECWRAVKDIIYYGNSPIYEEVLNPFDTPNKANTEETVNDICKDWPTMPEVPQQ